MSRATARQADRLDRDGDFVQAAALFRKAWQACPAKAGYLYRAGHALWMAGDAGAALVTLRAAIALPRVPKEVQFQAELEIAHVQALGTRSLSAAKPPQPPVKAVAPVKPAPIFQPQPPPVAKPTPPPRPPTAAPEPPTPVAAPAAPTPDAPPASVVVTAAQTIPQSAVPVTMPPHPPERHTGVAIAAFVVAGVAAVAALYFASQAVDRQDTLNQDKFTDSETFDLTRIGKPQAVTRTNAVLDWWNAALGSAVVGIGAAATGGWFVRDPDDAGTAVRQSVGRSDGVD